MILIHIWYYFIIKSLIKNNNNNKSSSYKEWNANDGKNTEYNNTEQEIGTNFMCQFLLHLNSIQFTRMIRAIIYLNNNYCSQTCGPKEHFSRWVRCQRSQCLEIGKSGTNQISHHHSIHINTAWFSKHLNLYNKSIQLKTYFNRHNYVFTEW